MMCSPTKVKKVTLWHPPPIGSLKLDDFFLNWEASMMCGPTKAKKVSLTSASNWVIEV